MDAIEQALNLIHAAKGHPESSWKLCAKCGTVAFILDNIDRPGYQWTYSPIPETDDGREEEDVDEQD